MDQSNETVGPVPVGDEPTRTGGDAATRATRGLPSLTGTKTALVALLATPGVLAVHAAVWWLMRLVGRSDAWDWGREAFGALFVSFGALFLLRWWQRRALRGRV